MKRFHRQVSKSFDESRLKEFTEELNSVDTWNLSSHCLERFNSKFPGISKQIENSLKTISLSAKCCFEYYSEGDKIIKAAYRYKWKNLKDLVLIIAENKLLVTVFINPRNDGHKNLDKSLYER